jgi:hypothetical protein
MSISFSELLCGYKESEIPAEHLANLKTLHEKISVLREKFGKPLTVSNAYRSKEHHLKVYAQKGITDEKLIPMKSKHLTGNSVDLSGPNTKEFQKWLLKNTNLLEELDLYLEDFSATNSWVHIQTVKFGSYKPKGTRFFIP